MGIFARFTDIVNANLNSMLDKAEDPEKMLRLIVQEMEETLVEVRAAAASAIADKKTLMRQARQLEVKSGHWQEKAELAVAKGRDDLAKQALQEKQKLVQQQTALEQELAEVAAQLDAIQQDSQRLQQKLDEAKQKQQAYYKRQQSLELRIKVKQQQASHNIDDAMMKFERYQQKIDRLEAELEAYDLTENQDLSAQIDALANDESLDEELAQLKQKVANS